MPSYAFRWTLRRREVALALALGARIKEAAAGAGVSVSSVYRWKRDFEFASEVEHLRAQHGEESSEAEVGHDA